MELLEQDKKEQLIEHHHIPEMVNLEKTLLYLEQYQKEEEVVQHIQIMLDGAMVFLLVAETEVREAVRKMQIQ